jgi:hypothetical protein
MSPTGSSGCLLSRMRFCLWLLAGWAIAFAGPANLIATADGQVLYFQLRTGIQTDSWFRLESGAGTIEQVAANLTDVSGDGSVVARSFYGTKTCGAPGSTCFLAPDCKASANIQGLSGEKSYLNRRTLLRLDWLGKYAWIEQGALCSGFGVPDIPPVRGLVDVATGAVLTTGQGVTLANQRSGRRMITRDGYTLVLRDQKLELLGPSSATRAVGPLAAPVAEAVVDALGCQVVYAEPDPSNALHWLDCSVNADEPLGFSGTAPALSEDGRYLVYINEDGQLAVYDRAVRRSVTNLLEGRIESFCIGGHAVFATIGDGSLVRMALDDGAVRTLVPPLPRIESVNTGEALYYRCSFPCYGPVEPLFVASPGMVVVLKGSGLRAAKRFRLRFDAVDANVRLHAKSSQTAWFQFPGAEPFAQGQVVLSHPGFPSLSLQLNVLTTADYAVCLKTTHQERGRRVTKRDPAVAGETIYILLTGLMSEEVAGSMLALADPGAADIVRIEPFAGMVGIQRVELLIRRPFSSDELFIRQINDGTGAVNFHGCTVPPVAPLPQ